MKISIKSKKQVYIGTALVGVPSVIVSNLLTYGFEVWISPPFVITDLSISTLASGIVAPIVAYFVFNQAYAIEQLNQGLQQEIEAREAAQAKLIEKNRQLVQANADAVSARQEAEKARQSAESASQAKSIFLANMSHELRTPLNAILGYSRILKRSHGDSCGESLDIIHRSGQHLLNLINDILDIARIEAGKIAIYPERIDFRDFLDELVAMARLHVRQKSLKWVYEPDPDLPQGIETDPVRLRQVLLNLLNNAIKFTHTGQVRFRVSRLAAEPDSAVIRFEISDTGQGIAPVDMERIFLPFEQAHEKGSANGSGLGLVISREFVRKMGADIQVQSEPGNGSCFWFELGLPVFQDTPSAFKVSSNRIIGYHGPVRSILVVDDQKENRRLLQDLLSPLGFAVHPAPGGQQGIETAIQTEPALILMDLLMPDINGFEAVKRIREVPALADTPVVAVSASYLDKPASWIHEHGFQAFLSKPVDIEQLFETLARHLGLVWQMDRDTTADSMPTETIVAPEPAIVQHLMEMASDGFMFDLMDAAKQLRAEDSRYQAFADQLLELARGFDIKRVAGFLQGHLSR